MSATGDLAAAWVLLTLAVAGSEPFFKAFNLLAAANCSALALSSCSFCNRHLELRIECTHFHRRKNNCMNK